MQYKNQTVGWSDSLVISRCWYCMQWTSDNKELHYPLSEIFVAFVIVRLILHPALTDSSLNTIGRYETLKRQVYLTLKSTNILNFPREYINDFRLLTRSWRCSCLLVYLSGYKQVLTRIFTIHFICYKLQLFSSQLYSTVEASWFVMREV